MDVKIDSKTDSKTDSRTTTTAIVDSSLSARGRPRRRHTVNITVSADNMESLRTALESIGYQVSGGRQTGENEGYSNSIEWVYVEDKEASHERYVEWMREWENRKIQADAKIEEDKKKGPQAK